MTPQRHQLIPGAPDPKIVKVIGPPLHRYTPFVQELGPVVCPCNVTSFGVGQLCFKHIAVDPQPLSRNSSEHGAKAVGSMLTLEPHSSECRAKAVAMQMRCVLPAQCREYELRALGKWQHAADC